MSLPPNLTPVMYPKMRWRTVVTWELDKLIVKLLDAAGNQSTQIHPTNLGATSLVEVLAPTLVTRPPSPQAHPVESVALLMRTNLTAEPLKLVRLLARLQDVAGTL